MSAGVEDATREQLEEGGRADTPLGRAALLLARQMDAGGDTASGLASLTGRWVDVLARALDGARAAADPLDEVQQRRQRRLGTSA